MGDLGQINAIPFNVRDVDTVRDAVKNSTTVVNLIGKHYETKHLLPWWINYTLDDVHVKAARTIAEISAEAGVDKLIHVSALNANPDSPSAWFRTKALGEVAVREAFPTATIVRPTDMFGAEDRFLLSIADNARLLGQNILINGGKQRLQPVDVQNVADAIVAVVGEDSYAGKFVELAGPREYERREVVQRVKDITQMPYGMVDLPPQLLRVAAQILEKLPNPILTQDQVVKLELDNVLSPSEGAVTFEDLGIKPVMLESYAYDYLRMYRRTSKLANA
jgi:NADH dehydrogenase (ubiquinone) 1 alpha subcomplex subunit 9